MSSPPDSLAGLAPAPYNPRTISPEAQAGLAASLREFGDLSGVVYNTTTGNLICAHQRREVALGMDPSGIDWGEPYTTAWGEERDGWFNLPGGARFRVRAVAWDEAKERAANIAANSPLIAGDYTSDLLGVLNGLDAASALDDAAAWTALQLDALADWAAVKWPEPAEDDSPPSDAPTAEPITRPGDVWTLGPHRLVCGDCSDPAVLALATDGKPVDLWVTDPPYGVDYASKNEFLNAYDKGNMVQTDIRGDTADMATTRALWDAAFREAVEVLKPGGCAYITAPPGPAGLAMGRALDGAGLGLRQILVWVKHNAVLGRTDYNYRHEFILYGWKPGAAHYFGGTGSDNSVWEVDRPTTSKDHPTMKPVELFARAYQRGARRGETVLDTYAGSGTCLLAAEATHRRVVATEIEPHYCDVAIRRWQEATGQEAERL